MREGILNALRPLDAPRADAPSAPQLAAQGVLPALRDLPSSPLMFHVEPDKPAPLELGLFHVEPNKPALGEFDPVPRGTFGSWHRQATPLATGG